MIAADYTGRRQQSGKREIMRDAHDLQLMLLRGKLSLVAFERFLFWESQIHYRDYNFKEI